jgi:lipopolysaccharide transport system ATP-binding protein
MKSIIEVNHLSKKYRYGESQPYYTLRDTLTDIVKNPFQLLKKNQAELKKNEFWALKDISFKLNQGEVLGVIGPNGSGKSTLLKILSRITSPTKGDAVLRGRVGSLLEVGTGFQQELTGRENIYLNGAILGMTKQEINSKFEEIVDFSGIEKFLDTPVKRYSSGMYMRLAFAVAAHLDSEILIVDEVLAVGDAEFQKKCLGKMEDISKNEGRTVLFVSHNMGAVAELCTKALVLENGKIAFNGRVDNAVLLYLNKYKSRGSVYKVSKSKLKNDNQFIEIYNGNSRNKAQSEYNYDEDIKLVFELVLPKWNDALEVGIFPCDKLGRRVFMIEVPLKNYYSGVPRLKLSVTIPKETLLPGDYSWEVFIHNPLVSLYDHINGICNFTINETGSKLSKYNGCDNGCVYPPTYSITKIT